MEGQSLDVSGESETGEVGKSLTMTWTVHKLNQTDIIQNGFLVLGNKATDKRLFQGLNPINERPLATTLFPDGINATWDGQNYTLIISKLKFEDDNKALTFVVSQTLSDGITPRGSALLKTITITEVRGMYTFSRLCM